MELILLVAIGVAIAPLVGALLFGGFAAAFLAVVALILGIKNTLEAIARTIGKIFDRIFKALS